VLCQLKRRRSEITMAANEEPAPDRGSRPGALSGIRVIELADELAEYCGLTLAGLGADVVKVEPPGGSPTRRIGPFYQDRVDPEGSLFFWQYNRGKRSIELDLQRERDAGRLRSDRKPDAAHRAVLSGSRGSRGIPVLLAVQSRQALDRA